MSYCLSQELQPLIIPCFWTRHPRYALRLHLQTSLGAVPEGSSISHWHHGGGGPLFFPTPPWAQPRGDCVIHLSPFRGLKSVFVPRAYRDVHRGTQAPAPDAGQWRPDPQSVWGAEPGAGGHLPVGWFLWGHELRICTDERFQLIWQWGEGGIVALNPNREIFPERIPWFWLVDQHYQKTVFHPVLYFVLKIMEIYFLSY